MADHATKVLTLNFKDQKGTVVSFKVKNEMLFSKIMQAYAQAKGIDQVDSIKFLLDEKFIKGKDTPKMLELEDGDEVQVVLSQVGGCA